MNRRQMFGFIGLIVGAAAATVLAMAAPRSPRRYIELPSSAPLGSTVKILNTGKDSIIVMGDSASWRLVT